MGRSLRYNKSSGTPLVYHKKEALSDAVRKGIN